MSIKLLVVEDMTITLLDLQSSIKKLGYEVVATASDYNEAISKFKDKQPNTILMDVNLGSDSKNGIEAAQEILSINPSVKIIYLTAYTDQETISNANP